MLSIKDVPALETFNGEGSIAEVTMTSLSSEMIKPEHFQCQICYIHFDDIASYNLHYRQCYAQLMTGKNNVGEKNHLKNFSCMRKHENLFLFFGRDLHPTSNQLKWGYGIDDNSSNSDSMSNHKYKESIKMMNDNDPNTVKHKSKIRWSCEHCPMTFEYKRDKIRHMFSHTGEKPFACMYCGKKWKNKTALKRHTHTHTGEKPYECNWCDKRYTQSTLLKSHCEKAHGVLVKFKKGKAVQVGKNEHKTLQIINLIKIFVHSLFFLSKTFFSLSCISIYEPNQLRIDEKANFYLNSLVFFKISLAYTLIFFHNIRIINEEKDYFNIKK
ncbi:zinc finger and SCAN domain containing 2-like protein [Reticulomyxa filosa]|uniref:Zinc finger and SCAN domain containing 2-like protein n=1 Tax=Reticulomyxa filosa TaxID=46433 RepID=X6P0D0_RETFI|nr:zinc finger and SCAN domain containing 2-like protein [Reticulomyxa filosa]|eukprot:ETO32015.1 zinc finger and SCAN domain containing 2-like protein [Reticulomyxa filosa]